jgi:outer membrane protein OmpA-like peptidoglycan-associated protein
MLSADQVGRMHFDGPGLLGELDLSYEALPWLDGQLSVHGGGFSSNAGTGGLLSPGIGLRLHRPKRPLTPFVCLDAGPAWTGTLIRPRVSASVGFDVSVTPRWTLGPVFGVDNVVQWNGANDSTDAVMFSLGVSVTYRRSRPEEPPPKKQVRHAVLHSEPPAAIAPPSVDIELLMESTFETRPARIELLAPVLFALDSDQLEPLGVAMLHEVASTLRKRVDIQRLEIQGYADQRGPAEHNEQLSRRRAERVRSWLVEHGIEVERLCVAAHGARAPIEAAGDEAAHQQNRRVIFRVLEARP